jgi:hypothetical protein
MNNFIKYVSTDTENLNQTQNLRPALCNLILIILVQKSGAFAAVNFKDKHLTPKADS